MKFVKLDLSSITPHIPKVVHWIEEMENFIQSNGRFLNEDELTFAKKIGILNYDIIKVWESNEVPKPKNAMIQYLGNEIGFFSSNTNGISFRYGIFLHSELKYTKDVLLHELIHTLQYERFGSIEKFILCYLDDVLINGYENSVLEKEANSSKKLLK
jgi:hypothetical protein